MDRQRQTNKLSVAEKQIGLPGFVQFQQRTPLEECSLSEVRKLKNESHALIYSVRCSVFEPKEIPLLLEMDEGQWSCIKSGSKNFPHNRRNQFMDLVNNEVLLMYGCESRGYDFSTLRKHQSDTEAKLEAAEARIRELERRDREKDEWISKIMGRA